MWTTSTAFILYGDKKKMRTAAQPKYIYRYWFLFVIYLYNVYASLFILYIVIVPDCCLNASCCSHHTQILLKIPSFNSFDFIHPTPFYPNHGKSILIYLWIFQHIYSYLSLYILSLRICTMSNMPKKTEKNTENQSRKKNSKQTWQKANLLLCVCIK